LSLVDFEKDQNNNKNNKDGDMDDGSMAIMMWMMIRTTKSVMR
jgi:hypothetical protein